MAPVAVTATPDGRKRLSEGIVVEASVLVRLLRIRLLRLDAEVVIVPAEVTAPPSLSSGSRQPPARSAGVAPPRSRPTGGRLAEAVRCIDEGAALLAEARRGGTADRSRTSAR